MRPPAPKAVQSESCGDFYPNGSWNPRAERRGPLYAFVAELCRACQAAPLAITPAVAARRIVASSFKDAFPNREQWAGIEPQPNPWLAAAATTSAERAVRASASTWLHPDQGWPLAQSVAGSPSREEIQALCAKRDAAPWKSIPEMTWIGDVLLPGVVNERDAS